MPNEHPDSTGEPAPSTGRWSGEFDGETPRDGTPDLYAAISHPHRRLVLSRILNADQPLSVDDLAEYVAERDRSFPSSISPADTEYQRMTVSLRNTHLPALADLGYIDYERHLVTANELTERAKKYIHMAAQDEHVRLAGRDIDREE